jgi:hypothetical protein
LAVVAAVICGTLVTRHAPETPVAAGFEQPLAAAPRNEAPAPAASPEAGPPRPGPGPAVPGVHFDQVGAGAGKPALGVEIVVRFKDDRKVQDMVDTFWKDAPSARRKFEAFKAGRPEFAAVQLDRVTYSNELVLVPIASLAPDKRAAQARNLAAKMGKAADISYAEANVTAKPGER